MMVPFKENNNKNAPRRYYSPVRKEKKYTMNKIQKKKGRQINAYPLDCV